MLKQEKVIDKISKETAAKVFGASTATEKWPEDSSRHEPKNISRESPFVTTLSIEYFVYLSNCSLFLFGIERHQEFVLVGMNRYKPGERHFRPEDSEDIVIFEHNSGGPYPLSMAVKGDFSMLAGRDEEELGKTYKHQLSLKFHVSRLAFPGDRLMFTSGSVART